MAASLTLPAPAKLNLRLHITGRRGDGFHLLSGDSILIDFSDQITISGRNDGQIVRDWQHPHVSDDADLCLRAARLLPRQNNAGVTIRVDKKIPVGGGLGGGSSNAASVLRGLNNLWGCGLSLAQLAKLSAPLGADVPFFVAGRAATIGGIGEPVADFTPIDEYYLLVFPPVMAKTADVYAEYKKLTAKIEKKPPALLEPDNELTQAAMQLYPAINEAAKALRQVAPQARLSGSGATVFSAFADGNAARLAQASLPNGLASVVTKVLFLPNDGE